MHLLPLACSLVFTIFFFAPTSWAQAASSNDVPESLTHLRENNTSASDHFSGTFNDLPKPGHISPLRLSSLLPNGNQTRFVAHFMPGFVMSCNKPGGKCAHLGITGYTSNDQTQVAKQLKNMYDRGFSSVFIDWNGNERKNEGTNETTLKVMREAERMKKAGFDLSFAVQPDKNIGAGQCKESRRCNTEKLIGALLYAHETYERSPAYLRWNGRPVVPLFWNEKKQPLDWDEIHSKVPGNPLYVFQSWSRGMKHKYSSGAYSWNGQKGVNDIGLAYLDQFYEANAKLDLHQYLIVGSAYAGFDDRMASWGKNKIIPRRCGLTWLDTIKESVHFQQLSGSSLPFLQVVTWNDYEEGTAMEMGIDNCVAGISATIKNNRLTWVVNFSQDLHGFSGSEETIAYYRVFRNSSGDKLQELKIVPSGGPHELDLSSFHLPSRENIFIEAVGKSQIFNHVSQPATMP